MNGGVLFDGGVGEERRGRSKPGGHPTDRQSLRRNFSCGAIDYFLRLIQYQIVFFVAKMPCLSLDKLCYR